MNHQREKIDRRSSIGSIAGVLVAAGMGAVVVGALSQSINSTQNAAKNVSNSLDFDLVKQQILTVLNDESLCQNAFRSPSAGSFENLKFVPDQSVYTGFEFHVGTERFLYKGKDIGSGLTIEELKLESVNGSVNSDNVSVKLTITAKKSLGSLGGPTLSNSKNPFLFNLNLDATMKVAGCKGAGTASQTTTVSHTLDSGIAKTIGTYFTLPEDPANQAGMYRAPRAGLLIVTANAKVSTKATGFWALSIFATNESQKGQPYPNPTPGAVPSCASSSNYITAGASAVDSSVVCTRQVQAGEVLWFQARIDNADNSGVVDKLLSLKLTYSLILPPASLNLASNNP